LSRTLQFSRRDFLALAGAAAALPLVGRPAFAAVATNQALHGLSAFGDLKYPPDFSHFDYVNPDAPKGGLFNFQPPNWGYNQSTQTFNTLNHLVPGGDSPPRMEMCLDSLLVRALDEPDALYGLLAESVALSDDRNSFIFKLRPEARWHDGTPLTAADIAFSFATYKEKGHPDLVLALTHMTEAVADDPATFRLVFDGKQSARTLLTILEFPVVSKAFYEANPFDSSQINAPLGSGPYKVGRVVPGQTIEYERVADYWGAELPVNRGQNNFARIRVDFYRDRQAAFEAFKKGDILFRQEFVSRTWATGYDFPAINDGKVIKREFPGDLRPSMQAHALNTRRAQFRDVRVRQAIGLCFDFEWANRNLFYGAYERSDSCFERSPYKAEGMPSREELALLEPLRDKLPPEAFSEAVTQPKSDGSGRDRKLLSQAAKLLAAAGWKRDGNFVVDDKGGRLVVEMMVEDETFIRVDSPFVENMRAIGIDASIRQVDSAQYQTRQASFDFDMMSVAFSFTATPTRDELDTFFLSRAAGLPGSRNLPGIMDPAVDALLDAVGDAQDRKSLTTAIRALDRVLRARRDWLPNWHATNHRAAYWDMFGFKEPKPDYGFPVEALWWFDEDKAKAIGKG
jgi:microcin C transport system substrate-binding protein